MNAPERQTLAITLDFLREWRQDDKDWKAATDKRLTKLENRAVAADAVEANIAEKATATHEAVSEAHLSKRWRLGIVAGIAGTAVVTVANVVLRLSGH